MTFTQSHLLGIEPLHPVEITALLDLAQDYAEASRAGRRLRLELIWPSVCQVGVRVRVRLAAGERGGREAGTPGAVSALPV